MVCITCNGSGGYDVHQDGCPDCKGLGRVPFAGCPWRQITPDVDLALFAARQAKLGQWPVAGGWLNQTKHCLEAVEIIERDRARMGLKD